jgi:hypothetical protein
MALLTNINGRFAVEDDGAIQFNGSAGSSGYVLESRGANDPPVWTDRDTGNVTGAGTLNKVVRWTATGSTIDDGPITFATNDSTFAGNVIVGNSTYGSSLGQVRIITDGASTPATLSLFGYNNIPDQGIYASIDMAMQLSGTGGQVAASIKGVADGTGENTSDIAFHTALGGTLSEKMRIGYNGQIGFGASTSIEGRFDLRMDFVGENWVPDGTSAKWAEVWDNAGAPGTYFDDVMLHVDTNRGGSTTGGVVGIAFSPGWQGHQNWGIYSINTGGGSYTSGDLIFTSQLDNGNIFERVRFQGTTGNVGIGATDPVKTLDVRGQLAISNSASSYWYLDRDDSTGNFEIFDDGDVNRLTIDTSGRVGIGVTPLTWSTGVGKVVDVLQLNGNGALFTRADHTYLSQNFYYNSADAGAVVDSGQASIIELGAGRIIFLGTTTGASSGATVSAVERMRITTGGQVGIGTPSPQDYDDESENLVIAGGFNGTNPYVGMTIACLGDQAATGGKGAIRFADGTSGNERYIGGIEYQHAGNDMFFRTNGSLRMAIDNAGNVGIGNTDPVAKLDVVMSNSGGATRQDIFRLLQDGQNTLSCYMYGGTTDLVQFHVSGSEQNLSLTTGGAATATTSKGIHIRNTTGYVGIDDISPSYQLDVAGTIRATGDIIAYSDIRVKENIKTIDNSLEKVSKLRGVEFNKIGNNEKSIGVIAQEIEKVIPEVVKEDDKGMKSVAYGNISGLLIEAIKELKAEIEELKFNKCNCNK